jgi:hypothetical protein
MSRGGNGESQAALGLKVGLKSGRGGWRTRRLVL